MNNNRILSSHTGTHVTPIYLNLYDLGGCTNTCIHSIGLVFYHCAVQTHSAEYGYMGHPYQFTGLYKTSKYDSRFHLYRLRHSIEVGWTWFNEKDIDNIVNDLKSFYLGWDYDTIKKNSIHFAKYLLQQLSNDSQLKLQIPSYIDRIRRWCNYLEFLQIFDTEKDIAEINILYFIYLKYEGNIQEICQILKCDTIDKLKRYIQLIKQGIQQKKLPIFSSFMTFDMNKTNDYLYNHNSDDFKDNQQLTLTDVFHQFDTITLRGRTSIDKYLNIQRENDEIDRDMILSHQYRSSYPQSISQNQGQTPLISPSVSNKSSAIPIDRLQDTSNFNLPLIKTDTDQNSLSLISNRQWKNSYLLHKRKLPRDIELTSDLYRITNRNLFSQYYHQPMMNKIPIEKIKTNV